MLLTNIIIIIFFVIVTITLYLNARNIDGIMDHMNEVNELNLKILQTSGKRLDRLEKIMFVIEEKTINAANHNTDKEVKKSTNDDNNYD